MRVEKAKVGFTLVEMAVVLVIVGLILSVTLPLLTEGIQRDKLTKGRQGISSLRDEIIGYALTHAGLLPTLNTVEGFASAEDPWGNLVAYWSDPDITEGAAADICSLSSAPNNLSLEDDNSGSTYAGVAFIIASRGANQNLQVGYVAGPPTVITSYTNGAEVTQANDVVHGAGTGLKAGYDVAAARTDRFDDVVQYVTFNYLRTRICTTEFGDQDAHAAVTFNDIAADFGTPAATGTATNYANQNGALEVDSTNNELSLGNDQNNAVGCLWWAGTNASVCGNPTQQYPGLCDNGTAWRKARFVFKFATTSSDESVGSTEEQGGFVFTLLGADTGTNDGGILTGTEAPCGRGDLERYLGYTGVYPDGTGAGYTVPQTVAPKYGVEVDYYTAGQGDPRDVDMTANLDPTSGAFTGGSLDATERPNHIAVVFWGANGVNNDNTHGSGTVGSTTVPLNPDWDPAPTSTTYSEFTENSLPLAAVHARLDGFMSNATHKGSTSGTIRTNWLEDTREHWLRIVFERVDGNGDGQFDNPSLDKMYVHVWVADNPSAAFKNVGADLVPQDPHGQAGYDLYENSTQAPAVVSGINTNRFRFGWTTATGTGAASTTILSDFAFNLGL